MEEYDPTFIAQDGWLEDTVKTIMEGLHHEDSSRRRVSPMALVRCSRGGKTRALREIARCLKDKGVPVILVSFNDFSDLLKEEMQDPRGALCLRIAFEANMERNHDHLHKKPMHLTEHTSDDGAGKRINTSSQTQFRDFRKKYKGSPEVIEEWLSDHQCVLLVDELNILIRRETPSDDLKEYAELCQWMKHTFLSQSGRYLVFSSHIATLTKDLATFMDQISERGVIVRQLPLIPSLSSAEDLSWSGLLAHEALYYAKIPALIFVIALAKRGGRQFVFSKREKAIDDCGNKGLLTVANVENLLCSFITGDVPAMYPLHQLMVYDAPHQIRWIPLHMRDVLDAFSKAGQLQVPSLRMQLRNIVECFDGFFAASNNSGGGWENLFLIPLMIRCLCVDAPSSSLLPINGEQIQEIGYSRVSYYPGCKVIGNKPEKTVARFIEDMEASLKHEKHKTYPRIVICYPKEATFPIYDVIVLHFVSDREKLCYGYQLKTGSATPREKPLKHLFEESFWICGDPPGATEKRNGWTVAGQGDIDNFFGVSGKQWTPQRWKELKEEEEEARGKSKEKKTTTARRQRQREEGREEEEERKFKRGRT